jgi:hypothetical protein
MNKWLIVFFLVVAFSKIASGETSIQDLSSLDQLRQAFQKDAGKVRIVAFLSPT